MSGRPVDADLSARILTESLRLIADAGFHSMKVEDVAVACGTSKQAVYRRWRSKQELAAEAVLFALEQANPEAPDSGDFRADLIAVLNNAFLSWNDTPLGNAIRALLAERQDPDLVLCLQQADQARRNVLRVILRQHAPKRDPELTIDLLLGGAWLRFLREGSVPRGYAKRVVNSLF